MEFVYKGLRADYQRHLVTDEEVDRNLERLRQQSPQVREIDDRPAENGDTVELDYAGFCGGEQFPGGTAQGQSLTLGSGTFIPGFEEQLLGCRPGEQVTLDGRSYVVLAWRDEMGVTEVDLARGW